MAGGFYICVCVVFGLAGGFVGRLKGSSFLIWFFISGLLPVLGLVAAILYRYETDELRRQCESCGKVCMLYDAICTRCGHELEFPEQAIEPRGAAIARARDHARGTVS